ncbi:hypothetical protein K8R47_00550 [archaeon]|nr:hypothetical protein [archaeon]
MAEQKEFTLEQKLLRLGQLSNISREIDNTQSPSERGHFYELATQTIAGPKRVMQNDVEVDNQGYIGLIRELTRSGPEYAQMNITGNIDNQVSEIEKEYNDKKTGVLEEITSSINGKLKDVKSKAEAAAVLQVYLSEFVKLKQDPTQADADEAENQNFKEQLGIPYAFDQIGSLAHYKDIALRSVLSDYLVQEGEGKSAKYTVDKEKIGKFTEDVKSGAMLYTRAKNIDEASKENAKRKK